jgi:hypothetical protein
MTQYSTPQTTPAITANITAFGSLPTKSLFNANTGTGSGSIQFDSNTLPTGNAQRAAITDYIRIRLGDGLIDVELEKGHYEMAINQALLKYRQRAANSTEESFAFLDLLPETQEYILPREVQVVKAAYRRGIGSVAGTTASQFEPFASGYLNTYMLQAGRVGGLTNYELFVDYQKLAMKMFGGLLNYTFNPTTKKLTIIRKMPYGYGGSTGGSQGQNPFESVLLHIYNTKPDQMILNDTYSFPWIQEYAYSFAKRILGQAYSKFSQIAGPQGGASLNGATMVQEAQAEMERLEYEIVNYVDNGLPLTFIVG